MNTREKGKFLGIVSVFGRARDAKGNIIDRDVNELPSAWITPLAGSIPNRNTITGSVIKRAGVPIDENGIISYGEREGNADGKRIIFGSYNLQNEHEQYGPQYSWNVIRDMSNASAKEIMETEEFLGEPGIFDVGRVNLPADYVRRTNQHVGRNRMDERSHSVLSPQQGSNVVENAVATAGNIPSDTRLNPEVQVQGRSAEVRNDNLKPLLVVDDPNVLADDTI